jgi:anaerobic selenocysteine-containing dehydrogenase
MRESFGSDGQPGSYADIDYTDCLFLVGHNVSHTQSLLWSRMLDRPDGPNPPKLIVVDPRRSDTAKRATVHLAPKIGMNLALLNGVLHLLFANGWVDEEYVSEHVVGLEQLKPSSKKITSVPQPQHQLKEAAHIISTTKSLLSTALQGVYQSNQATASACQIFDPISKSNSLPSKISVRTCTSAADFAIGPGLSRKSVMQYSPVES